MVITTAAVGNALPKVIVTLAGSEIDGLLAGRAERFPVTVGATSHDVEMIAASRAPPEGGKPDIRLRVADGALQGARIGTVTVFFEDVPFQLVLMCSDAPPAARVPAGGGGGPAPPPPRPPPPPPPPPRAPHRAPTTQSCP
jgi:hypothetical protein